MIFYQGMSFYLDEFWTFCIIFQVHAGIDDCLCRTGVMDMLFCKENCLIGGSFGIFMCFLNNLLVVFEEKNNGVDQTFGSAGL